MIPSFLMRKGGLYARMLSSTCSRAEGACTKNKGPENLSAQEGASCAVLVKRCFLTRYELTVEPRLSFLGFDFGNFIRLAITRKCAFDPWWEGAIPIAWCEGFFLFPFFPSILPANSTRLYDHSKINKSLLT